MAEEERASLAAPSYLTSGGTPGGTPGGTTRSERKSKEGAVVWPGGQTGCL